MLDHLRFQEIERAIFKVRQDGNYGSKYLIKGEPFMIIDNAKMSNFIVNQREGGAVGRSTEATISTIRGVSFNIVNGSIMLNLFNSIFGQQKKDTNGLATIVGTRQLINEEEFKLDSTPVGDVLIYIIDKNGDNNRVAKDQYTVEGDVVRFIKPITYLISYVYEEEIEVSCSTKVKQIGADLILSLEMQCSAIDIITEQKVNVLIKFDKVSVSTDLNIDFNNSGRASNSVVYVQGLVEDGQAQVNKELFTIEVV